MSRLREAERRAIGRKHRRQVGQDARDLDGARPAADDLVAATQGLKNGHAARLDGARLFEGVDGAVGVGQLGLPDARDGHELANALPGRGQRREALATELDGAVPFLRIGRGLDERVELGGRRRGRRQIELAATAHAGEALRGREALGHGSDAVVDRRELRLATARGLGNQEDELREGEPLDGCTRRADRCDDPVPPLARAQGGDGGSDVVRRDERVVRLVLVDQLGEDGDVGGREGRSASPSVRRGSQRPSEMRRTPRRASLPVTWTRTSSSADTPSSACASDCAARPARRRPGTHGTRGDPAWHRATRPLRTKSRHPTTSDPRALR